MPGPGEWNSRAATRQEPREGGERQAVLLASPRQPGVMMDVNLDLSSIDLTSEIAYIALLFGLFVVPRILQRWGVPTAITAFAIGAAASLGFGLFHGDETISLLATLGIVSLFLFAGLEVNFPDLRKGAAVLVQHLVIRILLVGGVAWVIVRLVSFDWRPAILVSLALLTPSTGFILDSLDSLAQNEKDRFWIRSKAIAVEMVALAAMFFTLKSESVEDLGLSTLALLVMILILPLMFRAFARVVLPHAPKSDFAFLVIVAAACALITRNLGVYYLVGAFIVGVVAQNFRAHMPSMQSDHMLRAVEALASLLVPFYFFHAGIELTRDDFSIEALVAGLVMVVCAVPVRLLTVALHRRLALKEPLRSTLKVAVPMLPTLVFTLVIAGILRDEYDIPSWLFGGLIVYAFVTTIMPALFTHKPPPDFTLPTVLPTVMPEMQAEDERQA
jgi:Kef-type K+ transport system membrane component KefB